MSQNMIIFYVLLDIAVVVAAARLTGRLFRRLGQPAVLGEIAAGIALGPTLLGLLPGDLDTLLFPPQVRGYLTVIAQLGLVLFMFIVGLEVDMSMIRGRERVAGAVAAASMVLPFGLGAGLALLLHPFHATAAGQPVPKVAFVLFLGVAMSITAMPVLARILTERGMQRTPIGVLAMACAAVDDLLGWCLLAVVLAVASGGDLMGVARILALTTAFAAVAFLLMRPALARLVPWYQRAGRLTPDMLASVLVGVLVSAVITEEIGVHTILGAFVFGAMMPRRGAASLAREILERLEQVSLLLLLPVFFVVAGLQVDIAAVGVHGLWQLGLILLVAISGKFLGAMLAARTQRMPHRQAVAIGLLMNTRGLTEIVILQVGVQLKLLDQTMYTLMVIMALVTTAMTGPLLRLVYPDRVLERELAAATRGDAAETEAYTVLVAIPPGNPDLSARLATLATEIGGREERVHVVLCRLLPNPVQLEVASGLGSDFALITEVGAELRRLAATLVDTDHHSRGVIARFAVDPDAELARVADSVRANVVLSVADLPALPATTTGVQVRLPDAPVATGSAVHAVLDGEVGGRAVLRVAAQVALARRGCLLLSPGPGRRAERQVRAALDTLPVTGLDARAADVPTSGAADLVVTASTAHPDSTTLEAVAVLRVHPDAVDQDEELVQTVERIAVGTPSPARP